MFQLQTISRVALGLFVSISLAACAGATHQTATPAPDTEPQDPPAALATFEKAAINTVGGGAIGAGIGAMVGVAASLSCGPFMVGCAPFTIPAATAAGAAIGVGFASLMSVAGIIGDIELTKSELTKSELTKTDLDREPSSITATDPVLAKTQATVPDVTPDSEVSFAPDVAPALDVSSDGGPRTEPNIIAAFFGKLDELLSPIFQVAEAE